MFLHIFKLKSTLNLHRWRILIDLIVKTVASLICPHVEAFTNQYDDNYISDD